MRGIKHERVFLYLAAADKGIVVMRGRGKLLQEAESSVCVEEIEAVKMHRESTREAQLQPNLVHCDRGFDNHARAHACLPHLIRQ